MDQTSGTISPLVIPYTVWKGRLSFQCGTFQKTKNDYKCNTWSGQKLSPQVELGKNKKSSKSISSRFFKFLYCLKNEQQLLHFNYPLFRIHFPTDSLSYSLSHLNIISSFILYSFFYHHLFFLYLFPTIIFFNEKCYIYNIFCNTFKRITSKSYVKSCY